MNFYSLNVKFILSICCLCCHLLYLEAEEKGFELDLMETSESAESTEFSVTKRLSLHEMTIRGYLDLSYVDKQDEGPHGNSTFENHNMKTMKDTMIHR